jgi:hypothetical protein
MVSDVQVANLALRAANNQKLASGLYKEKYGIGAFFKPKYILLQLSRLGLILWKPIVIVVLVAAIIASIIFYGVIEGVYVAYVAKALACVFLNVIFTIANAIIYAVNGITNLLQFGFAYVLNTMMYFFLQPMIGAINAIKTVLPFLPYDPVQLPLLMGGETIFIQPEACFSYLVPGPVEWGDWGSLSSVFWARAGSTAHVSGEYVSVVSQNGAELLYPQVNIQALAEGWWSAPMPNSNIASVTFQAIADNPITILDWTRKIIEAAVVNNYAAEAWSLTFNMGPIYLIPSWLVGWF